MALSPRMWDRLVCMTLLAVAACGPTVAISDHAGTSGGETGQPTGPPAMTSTTSPPTSVGSTDADATETSGDPCEAFGACPVCHDGFLIDVFHADGPEARTLLPTVNGGFLAVGTTDSPGSIGWIDADGSVIANAGPFAEGLVLESATWGPDDRIILAGRIEQQFWIGVTDDVGALLMSSLDDEDFSELSHLAMRDIRVFQHDLRGIFISAHLGLEPQAATLAILQFNHDVRFRHMATFSVEPSDLSSWARGASTLTSSETLVAVTRSEDGMLFVHRETPVPWNIAEWETFDVELPGFPSSLTALHGNSVVVASNDESAHLARVDHGDDVMWQRALRTGRVDRVGFDAAHDLVFVGASDADDALWIGAIDLDGNDVWEWTAPPPPEGLRAPVLDIVALPAGGVAISTSGGFVHATVRPYACLK